MYNYRKLLISVQAGQSMLESGAEIYRVEDTILNIAKGLGLKDSDCFVLPTGITATATDDDGIPITIVRRIKQINTDLEKISMYNDLSRAVAINKMTVDDVEAVIKKINERKPFPVWMNILAVCFVTGSFTIMFEGTLREAIWAFLLGPIIIYLRRLSRELKFSSFTQNTIGGATAVFLGYLLSGRGLINNMNSFVIGLLMLLVPGLTFTNGIRDTFKGDYVSGMARLAEAIVIGSGIGFGAGVALTLLY